MVSQDHDNRDEVVELLRAILRELTLQTIVSKLVLQDLRSSHVGASQGARSPAPVGGEATTAPL
jgi:hypothetical protein